MMKVGIVGLPNAGKSSLFNALSRAGAEAANYPFTTIEPNVAVVPVADELAFLALECGRLGDARVGQWFLEEYKGVTGDDVPAPLLHFYRVYRALRRANIAARHLDDPTVKDPDRFAVRARQYLELVEPVTLDRTT